MSFARRPAGRPASEAVVEPAGQLAGGHGTDPGGRQLDGERQANQPPADLSEPAALAVNIGQDAFSTLPEELYGGYLSEGLEGKLALLGDPQRLAARRDDPEVRGGPEQGRDVVAAPIACSRLSRTRRMLAATDL